MTNNNVDFIKELSEVFDVLSEAFYESNMVEKNILIQRAESQILDIESKMLSEKLKGLGA